eukprot:CAMPEP_0196738634 /NCGR_PEP_ID=MMETSP1091-20130531/15912_1 /TAXON_ID=302021 /ORGANISM="Rhodomonas sp., Strain CCMP768" /LENGTH=156 /DNA_ID=CAMNT_0042082611 /DNA_START=20 /DNA_END=491 /DNA_ORIENTATION=+
MSMAAPKHTIVLLQETASKSTRTFSDFESVSDAMNGICQLYEQRLKQMNPGVRNITYDITELYRFIDELGDLCCLVYNGTGAYEPHNKQWVKDRVFAHLKRMANDQHSAVSSEFGGHQEDGLHGGINQDSVGSVARHVMVAPPISRTARHGCTWTS